MAFSQSSRGSVIGSGGRSMRQHAFARLGIALNLPVSAPDILARAGLDFEVTTRPVLTLDDDGNTVTIPGKRATFRADESRPLGVVGERYEPFQNTAMRDALETMAGPSAIIENGGTTDGGAGTWLLAQAPSLDFTIGKDGARGYMLIENRHDGMGSLSVTPVSVRQVCMNGMMTSTCIITS